MSDLCFGWRMFFVEEEFRRENAAKHMVAPRMRVSAETESTVMVTRGVGRGSSWPNLRQKPPKSVADGCMRTSRRNQGDDDVDARANYGIGCGWY